MSLLKGDLAGERGGALGHFRHLGSFLSFSFFYRSLFDHIKFGELLMVLSLLRFKSFLNAW
jgi:hypothetical protein